MGLVLGTMTYVVFVAANIVYNEWMLYGSSALMGMGAAVLWTSHGAYITAVISAHEYANGLPPSSKRGNY
jgi:hypothetical protein